MLDGKQFPFIERTNRLGLSSTLPYLPISLTYRNRSVEAMALLDTGASVNVLPYEIGTAIRDSLRRSRSLGHKTDFGG